MAVVNKTLGQSVPGAVLTDLYVVPGGASATVSINICNVSVFAETYRVSVAPAGAADAQKQYMAYDTVLAANSSTALAGIYMRAGDVLRIYGSSSNLTFIAMGTESE